MKPWRPHARGPVLRAVLRSAPLLAALTLSTALRAADSGGELTLRLDARRVNGRGPLALANRLQPGLAAPAEEQGRLMAELRHRQRLPGDLSLGAKVLLAHGVEYTDDEWGSGWNGRDESRVNELHLDADLGAWQLSAGRKVLGWDVGYAFRPNDVVQQEERRALFGQTPMGRPLLMVEHFDADTAWSLVLVNGQRLREADDATRDSDDTQDSRRARRVFGAEEPALAARAYARAGDADLHAFARLGRHTGASLGAALAWVAGEEIELHASWRGFRAHDGWRFAGSGTALSSTHPWAQATLGGGAQWLLGAQWTGSARVSLLAELWHDGTAPADAAWRDWSARNRGLAALAQAASPALDRAVAGNLAWQAAPLDAPGLRRDNLYLRAAWQPEDLTLALDLLLHPADRGRAVGASLQWRAGRFRLDATLRHYGGPRSAVLAQLPTGRAALLAATIAF